MNPTNPLTLERPPEVDISIVIRTYNESRLVGELLKRIYSQKTTKTFEVLIVDSESTDNTLEVVREFPVTIHSLQKSDFTYGKALNLGIAHSRGRYIVVISGHCIPLNDCWIDELLKPIESNHNVGLCYGRQEGLYKKELGYPSTRFSERILFKQQYPVNETKPAQSPFLNNANSAFKRSIWDKLQFNEDLPGLEDLDFAIKAKNILNHDTAYAPRATVLHIHDENNGHVFRRFLREERAYIQIHNNSKQCQKSLFKILSSLSFDLSKDLSSAAFHKKGIRKFSRTILGYRLAQHYAIYWAQFEPLKNKSKLITVHNFLLKTITRGRCAVNKKNLKVLNGTDMVPHRVIQNHL